MSGALVVLDLRFDLASLSTLGQIHTISRYSQLSKTIHKLKRPAFVALCACGLCNTMFVPPFRCILYHFKRGNNKNVHVDWYYTLSTTLQVSIPNNINCFSSACFSVQFCDCDKNIHDINTKLLIQVYF
jgi:hypothetical protein